MMMMMIYNESIKKKQVFGGLLCFRHFFIKKYEFRLYLFIFISIGVHTDTHTHWRTLIDK